MVLLSKIHKKELLKKTQTTAQNQQQNLHIRFITQSVAGQVKNKTTGKKTDRPKLKKGLTFCHKGSSIGNLWNYQTVDTVLTRRNGRPIIGKSSKVDLETPKMVMPNYLFQGSTSVTSFTWPV